MCVYVCSTEGVERINTIQTTTTLFVVYFYVVCCGEFKSAVKTREEQQVSSLAAGLLQ